MGEYLNFIKQLRDEWPTLVALASCYFVWFGLAFHGEFLNPALVAILLGLTTTFYWSLVHEAIHGHPTPSRKFNELLVAIPLGWIYPVTRFRETHLDHHQTGELTDPFDDPESWYMAEGDWLNTQAWMRQILNFNNTLFGRLLIGPLITVPRFVAAELNIIRSGGEKAHELIRNWIWHGLLCTMLAGLLLTYSSIPVWCFIVAAYLGTSLLLIRTFLEHQASEEYGERTVIIEASCPIAFLFLYNNLHCVHHAKPGVAWFRLPKLYRQQREHFVSENNGYVYRSYIQVICKYFFTMKEPVMHPHLRKYEQMQTGKI